MKEIKGDLFDGDWDIAVHCANIYNTFGAGIAKTIKEKYPQVYEADCDTDYGDTTKLGFFSYDFIGNTKSIFNLYAMVGIGNNGSPLDRNLRYDHFYDGFYRICQQLKDRDDTKIHTIGVPKYIGCALAGGEWTVVEAILCDLERKFHVNIDAYYL